MFWEEDEDKSLPFTAPEDVVDLVFSIRCKTLPIDHAWALSQAITEHLPWIKTTAHTGIHQIHVAESNNGWMRPEDDEENVFLHPSRRTKMTLRIPIEKIEDAQQLSGATLDINGHPLHVGHAKKKIFTNSSVLFSRYVLSDTQEDENQFLNRIAAELKHKAHFNVKKMLCGKSHAINTPADKLTTRNLMIADLDSDTSIQIQQLGLGEMQQLGCGLFIPHKGIKSLNSSE